MEKRDRSQISFLPECVEDTISDENPVRVIDAFVDSLDMEGLGFQKAKPAQTGRPAYDPRDLLKLYLYGYLNRIRSSRMLMRECRRNIELFYLLGGLKPDYRTIADFRKDNAQAIRNCFQAFGKLCVKLGLYNRELLAVDGTKIRAVNSKDNCCNQEVLEKKLAHIDEKLSAYLAALDEEDTADRGTETAAEKIKAAIEQLRSRQEKYEGILEELRESGEKQILTTDPEARRMHSKDGFHCCYNVQMAVDSGSHQIAENEVTNQKDREYCRACRNKCTHGEWKEVSFGPEKDCVPVRMFGILTEGVQEIPPDARISPSNHTLDTGHVPKKKVVLRIQDDKEKLKQRMCLSEHPFGTVKWYRGAHYLLCKGKEKAAAELGLSFLAYNMTRAIIWWEQRP